MSDSRRSDTSEGDPSLLARLDEWYHVPAMVLILVYMLWIRIRSYDSFIQNGEVFFSGNDPYYHLRETTYVVKHWPQTMPFDPWTYYPYGTSADQFGTLFDQLIATAALIVGLGDPSSTLIAKTLLVAPAVFGTLVAVPVFFMGRRLGGRFGGLFGVAVLALLPGSFLRRGLVGSADHHVAEALFQAVAVLGIMVALAVAEREKPIYELVVDRDVETLRAPLGWAGLAGVAMALYIWTWPPGVLLFAVAGVFFVVKLSAAYLNGDSPEPVAFVGAVSMGVAGLLTMLPMNGLKLSPTSFGPLQPLLAFGVAIGCVFMAWLAREWDSRDYDVRLYPVAVFGLIGVVMAVIAVALPDVFSLFVKNFRRFIGFSAGAETRTIGEAQPFLARARGNITGMDLVFREYGAMFFVAIISAGYILARPLLRSNNVRRQGVGLGAIVLVGLVWQFNFGGPMSDVLPLVQEPVIWEMFLVVGAILVTLLLGDHEAEEMFVVTWALFMTAAAFTQIRFNYYLAVAVAVLTAYAVGKLMELLGVVTPDGRIQTDIEPYQVMALMLALMVILPGLIVPVQIGGSERNPVTTTQGWKVGNSTGPSHVTQWDGSLEWMQNNTPAEGNFGAANESMEYYGTYKRPKDGDFDYGNGTYGVMSWWDYGHWITVEGKRIPNANPFQQGATEAANFLLAPNETQANRVLDEMGKNGEQTRYVMVDWKMVQTQGRNAKFSAPTIFYTAQNVSTSDFISPIYTQKGQRLTTLKTERYFKSMMVRLYKFHGSAARPQPYVIQWENVQGRNGNVYKLSPKNRPTVKKFRSVAAARKYAQSHSNARLGSFGNVPPEYIPALEHYRLVKVSQSKATSSGDYVRQIITQLRGMKNVSQRQLIGNPNWVKTFERVEGATLVGTGPENATVRVSVKMKMTTTNRTFTYFQRAKTGPDGKFKVTVPYSTEGYDNFGPENGHTNVSVRAVGPYQVATGLQQKNNTTLVTYRQTVNVSEAHVLGHNESAIRFDMNKREIQLGPRNKSNGSNNSSAPANNSSVLEDRSSVSLKQVSSGSEPVTLGAAPESDSRLPANGASRGGILLLLLGGLLVEVRD